MKNIFKKKAKADSTEGLPEVAAAPFKKNPMILVVIGITIAIVGSMYFYTKSKEKVEKPLDETYVISNTTEAENKPADVKIQSAVPLAVKEDHSADQVQVAAQMALIQEKQRELQQRLAAPLMVVNNMPNDKTVNGIAGSGMASKDPNTQFMQQVSAQNTDTVTATTLGPLNWIIAQGALIHAILEPATNSDLPGFVRAIVSEPNYSEDGSQVLIPAGSRLIGQYKSGMLQGQARIFIVWTRLITPAGISMQIGSPGVDSLGVAGSGADEIDRHFWERFGTGSLLSLIGAGAANVGVTPAEQENSAATYRDAVASSFEQSASQSLQQESNIVPTLTTYQGKPIMVFVAKDLNFQTAMKAVSPSRNIF